MTLPLFESAPLAPSKPLRKLRPYQDKALVALRAMTMLGRKRILAVGPTGVGKMTLIAAIMREATVPCIFMAHRQELIEGCVGQLADVGITNFGIIRGDDERFDLAASIQVCSIQTLSRPNRDKPFAGQKVLIFIDEAHRAASDSYLDLLKFYPDAIVIGFTATPTRLDGRPLGGDLFEEILIIATYQEMLKHPEWLVAPDCYSAPTTPDLGQVRMAGSDFDEAELARVMQANVLEGGIIEHWLRLAHRHPVFESGRRQPNMFADGPRRRTIVFAVNIAHSQSIASRFEAVIGRKVAHLDGNTKDSERKAIWKAVESGELEVVCNCAIGVEGVDCPPIKCVVHARPTHSITLWRQSIGREMRPWNNIVPLLLDHGLTFDRLGCPFEDMQWSLKARPSRGGGQPMMKRCKTCNGYVLAGLAVCSLCGAEFPPAERGGTPVESAETLVQRQTEPEALKSSYFARQVTVSKTHGFKPGYASKLFKDHYGVWPPNAWSDRVKAEFEQDAVWKATMERRLARNASKKSAGKREAEEWDKKPPATPGPIEERDTLERQMERSIDAMDEGELFGDWVDGQL